jgi:dTMP kinase
MAFLACFPDMAFGIFITLEGGEGVGKSTQLRALADRLTALGKSVAVTREPGGTVGAESIRHLLLSGEGERWTPQSEALLFAAARADHVAHLIKPALARGDWVLCDRYLESSRAYQGAALGLGDDAICALHRIGSHDFQADRVLVLDLSEASAAARLSARGGGDRIEDRGTAFHGKVRAAFRDMAAAEPERFRLIGADAPIGDVTDALMAAIADLL